MKQSKNHLQISKETPLIGYWTDTWTDMQLLFIHFICQLQQLHVNSWSVIMQQWTTVQMVQVDMSFHGALSQ